MCELPSRLIRLKAEESELAALEGWLASLAIDFALPPSLAFRIDLCLTETMDNVVAHGYPDGSRGTAAVGFWFEPDAIVIRVEDDGVAFDPTQYEPAPLPRSLAEAAIGGRGIRLLRQYADQIRYERRGDANHLALLFYNVSSTPSNPGALRGESARSGEGLLARATSPCPDLACPRGLRDSQATTSTSGEDCGYQEDRYQRG